MASTNETATRCSNCCKQPKMRRAIVSDLIPSKKFVIRSSQEGCYSISPLAAPDPVGGNRVPPPEVALKSEKKPRKRPKQKTHAFTIDTRENEDGGRIAAKPSYRRRTRPVMAAASPRFVSLLGRQPDVHNLKASHTVPVRVLTEPAFARDMRSSLLIKNTLRMSLNPVAYTRSAPKAIQLELHPAPDIQTTALRKIKFGNHTVIHSTIPSEDTIVVDDGDDFDIFKPPNLKTLPDNIFEPISVKNEEDTIFNEDVLINSDSISVGTLSQYEIDWHSKENEEDVAQLCNLKMGAPKRRENDREVDDRVETLRDINAGPAIASDKGNMENGALLEHLSLQIKLLEDMVYGKTEAAEKTNSFSNGAAIIETKEHAASEEAKDINDNHVVASKIDAESTTAPADESKTDGTFELLCDAPFANTYGKPDEVVIESDNKDDSDGDTVHCDQAKASVGEIIIADDRQAIEKKDIVAAEGTEKSLCGSVEEETVSAKAIEQEIRQSIRAIVEEETGSGCSGEDLARKLTGLQRIIAYFLGIIDREGAAGSPRCKIEVRFVEKLVDSALSCFAGRRQPRKAKSQKVSCRSESIAIKTDPGQEVATLESGESPEASVPAWPYMEPLLFSDIEEIIGTATKTSEAEAMLPPEPASTTPGFVSWDDVKPFGVKVEESLRTYSRKRPETLAFRGFPTEVLASIENKPRAAEDGPGEVEVAPSKKKRGVRDVRLEEVPTRRMSQRTRKRPVFYGMENDDPKRRLLEKD